MTFIPSNVLSQDWYIKNDNILPHHLFPTLIPLQAPLILDDPLASLNFPIVMVSLQPYHITVPIPYSLKVIQSCWEKAMEEELIAL